MIGLIEYLGLPATIAIVIVALLLVMQLIGEILELKGKIVPEFMKIRKIFKRKKAEKEERIKTLKEV
jgi:predicted Holliday junction resolvase-like endonuclease